MLPLNSDRCRWFAGVSPANGETVAEGVRAAGSVLVRQFALAEVLGEDAEALKGTLSLWEMTLAVTPPHFHSTVNLARIQGGVSF